MGEQAPDGELPTTSRLRCHQTAFSSWVVLLLVGRFRFLFIPCLMDCAVLLLKTCLISPALHPKVPTIRHNPALGQVKDGGSKYETSDKKTYYSKRRKNREDSHLLQWVYIRQHISPTSTRWQELFCLRSSRHANDLRCQTSQCPLKPRRQLFKQWIRVLNMRYMKASAARPCSPTHKERRIGRTSVRYII
jgi:hypothetical protein